MLRPAQPRRPSAPAQIYQKNVKDLCDSDYVLKLRMLWKGTLSVPSVQALIPLALLLLTTPIIIINLQQVEQTKRWSAQLACVSTKTAVAPCAHGRT